MTLPGKIITGMQVTSLSSSLAYAIFHQTHIYNIKTRTPGTSRYIIATVEQLFKTPEGRLPRLAILVRNQHFQKRLKHIHVDEAHFIYLAGLPRHGNTAF